MLTSSSKSAAPPAQELREPSRRGAYARLASVEDFRCRAQRVLPRPVFDFIDGGAGHEGTLRANRDAFDRITLLPKPLVDVSQIDQSITVFGRRLAMPVLAAPTGLTRLVDSAGELAVARALRQVGSAYVVSVGASQSLEAVADAADGAPLWFQIFLNWRSSSVVRALVERARSAGYEVLCVTVDSPGFVRRDRDVRNRMSIPPRLTLANAYEFLRHGRWARDVLFSQPVSWKNLEPYGGGKGDSRIPVRRYIEEQIRGSAGGTATWDEFSAVRKYWDGPIIVKGVLTPEAAVKALDHGADGVIVSNHGGRELDALPATVEALPRIADVVRQREKEVLVDGGFRRGSDVVKGLALGARAVLVGRPYWWGLAIGGEEGVVRIFEMLREEVQSALSVLGCASVGKLGPSVVSIR